MESLRNVTEFSWVGSQQDYVDQISIQMVNQVAVGRFGGNSSAGQYKNEDGCLVWLDNQANWEFVVLLDAHNSAESAELVIELLNKNKSRIQNLLTKSYEQTIIQIESLIVSLFKDEEFLLNCSKVQGETACLIILRKDKYLWWFSIGDCISHLFHPELARLGQYQLNQRQFFEWVGQVNTFAQPIPCYSTGRRELRKGRNKILLTTDGLIECPNELFSSPSMIYETMDSSKLNEGIVKLLETIKNNNVRDSTTIISWDVIITDEVTIPSNV
ncbi:protein phosphatase 2C domain-containing protein [Ornithinibacillus californiensis]|uniref:protein phosphatase 2C domain-containing protein n=1 Tax=Ornithinibacillus californiensis TaxID=161536 RepID=UPI00064E1202|nr:protein phosphatase 2C domain-containing protein [Ornithinibacillus californiensis]